MSETRGGQAPRHRAAPCAARLTTEKAMQRDRPTRFGPLRQAALASRPDPRVGHIHSSRCRTTRSGLRPGDAPAGRTSGEFLLLRTGSRASVSGARFVRPSPLPRRSRWWSKTGSNRRPHACKARALPTELLPRSGKRVRAMGRGARSGMADAGRAGRHGVRLVGLGRLELPTSRLSSARSNQLSYKPRRASRRRTGLSAGRKRNEDGGVPPMGP